MDLSEVKNREKTCAVITAAGLSSRMGRYKPLLPYGGSTIARCCIDHLRNAGVMEIVIVTGYRGYELREELKDCGVIFAENPDYRTTHMFDSLCIGLAALPKDCSRVLVQPIDMPAILPETIAALLGSNHSAVRPVCAGISGHPLLLDASLLPRICAYGGEDGLRGALKSLQISVEAFLTEDVGTLMDADTAEDYEKLLQLEAQRQ